MAIMMLLLPVSTLQAGEGDLAPFRKALGGLEGLYYVNQAIQQQSHKGTLTRISSTQAVRSLRSANQAIGFEYTERVQEILDFYTSSEMRKGVEIMLGLADTYMSEFARQIDSDSMPKDLMYLPLALSSLNPKAVSEWGASGLWQIMYTNGKLYNLQIDSYVDQRRDPVASTRAALQHLKDLHDIYMDWELAIAAYSSSPASINKAIRKAGGSKKYTDLYPYLPEGTRDYLPAFTACYILMHNYQHTGLKPYDLEVPNFTIKEPVPYRMHLGQVAEVLGMPVPLLQDMNPEYKSSIIPTGGGLLSIKLPPDRISSFQVLADSIRNFKDSVYFPLKRNYLVSDAPPLAAEQNGRATASASSAAPRDASPPQNRTKLSYTVKEGDNLGYISGWYNVSITEIRQWNQISGNVIRVGQVLDIWVPDSRVAHYKEIDGMTFEQKQKYTGSSTSSSQVASSSSKPTTTGASTTGYTWYTVKSGDNPTSIAAKYPGVSADDILKLNNISDPRKLQAGQKIKIPKK